MFGRGSGGFSFARRLRLEVRSGIHTQNRRVLPPAVYFPHASPSRPVHRHHADDAGRRTANHLIPHQDDGRIYADFYGKGTRAVVLAHGGRFIEES